MEQIEILFNKNVPERKYLINKIKENEQILLKETAYLKYDKITIGSNQFDLENILQLFVESAYLFLKFRVLNSKFKDSNIAIYDRFALIGALLSVDQDNDKRSIANAIVGLKCIAIESLIEFRLCHLKKNWNELATIAYKLSNEISSKNDLYELISYFISGIDKPSRVIITDSLPPNIMVNGDIFPPFEFTKQFDLDLLLSVISKSPSHVIIKNQELLSNNLLETFRTLGK